jgi:hypothetical protein
MAATMVLAMCGKVINWRLLSLPCARTSFSLLDADLGTAVQVSAVYATAMIAAGGYSA